MFESTVSDNELLYMIYQNNQIALKVLAKRYEVFARSLIGKHCFFCDDISIEYEDLLAVAMEAFYSAIKHYSPDRGIFYSFAKTCILRACYNTLRREKSYQETPLSLDLVLNPNIVGAQFIDTVKSTSLISQPEILFQLNEEAEEYFKVPKRGKGEELKTKILAYHILGYPPKEIAEMLNVTERSVRRLLSIKLGELKKTNSVN